MTVEAARAGKHVLCEKPMACSVAECDAMIQACEQAGFTLSVVFQGRFDTLARSLKSAMAENRLGRLLWVGAITFWYLTDDYYRSAAWRGTWAHEGGGVLINQAIHLLDLLIWLAGLPARVTAQMRTLNHAIEVEDEALAILEYEDGALGVVQATTNAYPGLPERLDVFGTNGSVIYHRGEGRLEWHLIEPREERVDRESSSSGAAQPLAIGAAGHMAQMQDFAAAIREKRPPAIGGREGRRSIELVEAIYRSARTNAPVSLGLG